PINPLLRRSSWLWARRDFLNKPLYLCRPEPPDSFTHDLLELSPALGAAGFVSIAHDAGNGKREYTRHRHPQRLTTFLSVGFLPTSSSVPRTIWSTCLSICWE